MIFAKEGEEGFRDRETRALEELTAMPNIVMATGGGAVGCEENRKLLQQGFVIYLEASVDTQLIRTKKTKPPAAAEWQSTRNFGSFISKTPSIISRSRNHHRANRTRLSQADGGRFIRNFGKIRQRARLIIHQSIP